MQIHMILIYILTFLGVGIACLVGIPLYQNTLRPKVESYGGKTIDKNIRDLDEMFIVVERKKLAYLYFLLPLVLAFISFLIMRNFLVMFLAAGLGYAIPGLWIRYLDKQRRAQFNSQLIDALMIMSSSLKGGLSLLQSLEEVAEEMNPPLKQEFGIVLKHIQLGSPLNEALEKLRMRMTSDEVNLLVTAIALTQQTGGDLPFVLGRLVQTLREKNKINQQIKTLSLQGRIQGIIMSILPIVFFFVVYSMNKDFFEVMVASNVGQALLIYAVVSQVIGMLLIAKFSKVEV